VEKKAVAALRIFIARQHDALYGYSKSVRPSVRYVPVSDENGLTYRHSFFSPYGSPIILVEMAFRSTGRMLKVGTPRPTCMTHLFHC